jgi:hypothetical protein
MGEPIREDTIMLRYNWGETNLRIDWLTKEIFCDYCGGDAIEKQQAPTARSHR